MIVGEVVIQFSMIEIRLALILNDILKSNVGTEIFADRKFNSETKIKKYKKAVRDVQHPEKNEFVEMVRRFDNCRKKRNEFVHNIWVRNYRTKNELIGFNFERISTPPTFKKINSNAALTILKELNEVNEEVTLLLTTLIMNRPKK